MTKTRIPAHGAKVFSKNALKSMLGRNDFDPIILAYHATIRCNLSCGYCKGRLSGFYVEELGTEETKDMLKKAKKAVPSLAITGGEPLIREDIIEIAKYAKSIEYFPITLFTNGLLLDKKEEILDYVDVVITSLDSTHKSQTDKIVDVIKKYSKKQKEKKFMFAVNCVITPETLDDVLDVAEFAFENGAAFTLGPQVNNRLPNQALVSDNEYNKKYKNVIDQVIEWKKQKKPIMHGIWYLKTIRNLSEFKCHPTTVPVLFPNGDIYFPCYELRTIAGNLNRAKSWDEVWQEGVKKYGDGPWKDCTNLCHLGCYIEPTMLIEHPMEIIKIPVDWVRSGVSKGKYKEYSR